MCLSACAYVIPTCKDAYTRIRTVYGHPHNYYHDNSDMYVCAQICF